MSRARLARVGAFAAVLVACLGRHVAGADGPPDLPRGESAKQGREATAFLEAGPGQSATAFCIHPSGLFVTNDHAIGNAQGNLKLVVHAGTLEQKVCTAKV